MMVGHTCVNNEANIDFFKSFKTVVFDCDGVVLDSNKTKTEAFRVIAKRYGDAAAESLVKYHTQNGGISRQKKFEILLKDILGFTNYDEQVEQLSTDYGSEVFSGLMNCNIANGLHELKLQNPHQNWMIVSGGSQKEIREIFLKRNISEYFDSGIYGNPDSKDNIMKRLVESKVIEFPALFIGDSRYDHQISEKFGLDFVFVSEWTEFSEWQMYCKNLSLKTLNNINEFLPLR